MRAMLSPNDYKTVSTGTVTAGTTAVVARPPGAADTAVTDAVFADQAGQLVTITSALDGLPILRAGELFAIEDAADAGNNGVFEATGTPTTAEVIARKLGSVEPADAVEEEITIWTGVARRAYIKWFHLLAVSGGTATLLGSESTLCATTGEVYGGPVYGNVGESIKVAAATENGSAELTYGWLPA